MEFEVDFRMGSRAEIPVWILFVVFVLLPVNALAVSEADVLKQLDKLRGVSPVAEKEFKKVNARLDSVWNFLSENSEDSSPIIQRELEKELAGKTPDQFFIMDLGFLWLKMKGDEGEELALRAFDKVDPQQKIIQLNDRQYFLFASQLARRGNSSVLASLDRAFLEGGEEMYMRDIHFTKLSPSLKAVFVYGQYGPGAEGHLAEKLAPGSSRNKIILESLNYLGSEKSVVSVKSLIDSGVDFETFVRAFSFLMRLGGEKGLQAAMNIDPAKLDKKSREYFEPLRGKIRTIDYQFHYDAVNAMPGARDPVPDQDLKRRLQIMYNKYGQDDELHPIVVLNAGLPREYLLEEMIRIRSRMFYRMNRHVLEDVSITNKVINALQFQ